MRLVGACGLWDSLAGQQPSGGGGSPPRFGFFAFDVSVTPGPAEADDRTYGTAVQSFNAVIDGNPLFGMVFPRRAALRRTALRAAALTALVRALVLRGRATGAAGVAGDGS